MSLTINFKGKDSMFKETLPISVDTKMQWPGDKHVKLEFKDSKLRIVNKTSGSTFVTLDLSNVKAITASVDALNIPHVDSDKPKGTKRSASDADLDGKKKENKKKKGEKTEKKEKKEKKDTEPAKKKQKTDAIVLD